MSNFKWKNNCVRKIYHATEYIDIDTAQIWTKDELKKLVYKIIKRETFQQDEHVYSQTYVKIIGKQLTLF